MTSKVKNESIVTFKNKEEFLKNWSIAWPNNKIDKGNCLYVFKGTLDCLEKHHSIKQAKAIVHNRFGNEIELLNVQYCENCKRHYINYNQFKSYQNIFGIMMGCFKMHCEPRSCNLAEASPLGLCGYSVDQKHDLNDCQRHIIIDNCIGNGTMTIDEVRRLLKWLIDVNGSKKANRIALSKWKNDYNYVNGKPSNDMKIIRVIYANRFIILD